MKRRRRSVGTPLALWVDTLRSAWATAATLSVRVPQLVSGTMSADESRRMVSEKVVAVTEGAIAGSRAAGRIATRRRRISPATMMADAVQVAAAMSAPARRRVKANAKRLGAPSKRKRR